MSFQNGKIIAIVQHNTRTRLIGFDCTTDDIQTYANNLKESMEESLGLHRWTNIWQGYKVIEVMKCPCKSMVDLQQHLERFKFYEVGFSSLKESLVAGKGVMIERSKQVFIE